MDFVLKASLPAPLSPALSARKSGVHFPLSCSLPQPLHPSSLSRPLPRSTKFSQNRGPFLDCPLPKAKGRHSRVVPIANSSPEGVPIAVVSPDDIAVEIPYHIIVYKDGSYKKTVGCDMVPAGVDLSSGVQSKDVVILPDAPLSARLYIPKPQNPTVKKLPVLFFCHGGGFITGTAAEPNYHHFLNLVAAESNVLIVSVDYRTAPDHLIPAPYNDSWEAIKWAAQHAGGNGPEAWLNQYANLTNVFFAGDSAGANIAHQMGLRFGTENPGLDVNLQGIILLNPYFWGKERVGSETKDNPFNKFPEMLWTFTCPETSGMDDPLINPGMDPKISDLGVSKVLIYVAGDDNYKSRGYYYKDVLDKSGWNGEIEINEDKGVGHVYFISNPDLESARKMRTRISTFINN